MLVAEDNRNVKYIYHRILEKSGHEVINAYNGEEAVEQYKKHNPDIVMMDIAMPVKNGDDAIKEILEYDPEARIIAVTAYNHSEAQLGVPVLKKGFRKGALLDLLKKHIEE